STHRALPLISSLSLHDALPIFEPVAAATGAFVDFHPPLRAEMAALQFDVVALRTDAFAGEVHAELRIALEVDQPFAGRFVRRMRSEEHTSELQSHLNLVCRLLL